MAKLREVQEVLRVSQWAEIRHMHFVQKVAKRDIARRLDVDVKTVRRALSQERYAAKTRKPRPRVLDPHRGEIERWLRDDRKITAKRIARLLETRGVQVSSRATRQYVAQLKAELFPKEAFVDRTHLPGETMEVDFGESVAEIGGRVCRVKYFVATLPSSNAYFAKAYFVERFECLLDGILEALRWFRGLPARLVLDNTRLAVKEILAGRDRIEHCTFHAFRGELSLGADFCAPAKGWEKGSVEGGVGYVRDNCFRPRPQVETIAELNAGILAELEIDLDRRHLPDGRTVRQALTCEREHLRPVPERPPEACKVVPCLADKFGRIRIDNCHYSVPIHLAYRPVIAKVFHDQIVIAARDSVVARHDRSFTDGHKQLEPIHVLPLLEKKHRAVGESTAIQQWKMPEVFRQLRNELEKVTRKPDQEWIRVLRLIEQHPQQDVERAVARALEKGSPRLETVRMLLRSAQVPDELLFLEAVPVSREDLAQITVSRPVLKDYDMLSQEVTP